MRLLTGTTWNNVVFNTASCLTWQSYDVCVEIREGLATGGGIDRRHLIRDFNCLGLPDLVDGTTFRISMQDFAKGFDTIFIFEETSPSDYPSIFCEWVSEMPLGRFVSVALDGSHGENAYFAAMFRGDDASCDQAMLFKLKYC